jgi:single-strand DNA-binding protein
MLKLMIIGNVGGEPAMGKTKAGKDYASFSIAESRTKKEQATGDTVWFNVYCYGAMAESIAKFVHKGSKLFVMGELVIEKYKGKDGVERESRKISYPDIKFLDLKRQGGEKEVEAESQEDFGLDDIPF